MRQKSCQPYTPDFKERALGQLSLSKPFGYVAREL